MTLPLQVLEVHDTDVLVRPADGGPGFRVDRAAVAGDVHIGVSLTLHTEGGRTHYAVVTRPRPS